MTKKAMIGIGASLLAAGAAIWVVRGEVARGDEPRAVAAAPAPAAAAVGVAAHAEGLDASALRDQAVAAVGGALVLRSLGERSADWVTVLDSADGRVNQALLHEKVRSAAARVEMMMGSRTFSVVCRDGRAALLFGNHRVPLEGVILDEALRAGYDDPLSLLARWLAGAPARLRPSSDDAAPGIDVVEIEDPLTGPVQVELDATTHLIRALSFQDSLGSERVEYSEWAGEGAILVPHRRVAVRTEGGHSERMDSQLVAFDTNEALPDSTFALR